MPDYRLRFDVPETHVVAPAIYETIRNGAARLTPTEYANFSSRLVTREPTTRAVLLKPRLDDLDLRTLPSWTHQSSCWASVNRSQGVGLASDRLFASARPTSGSPLDIQITPSQNVSLAHLIFGTNVSDTLVWALESTADFARNQSICVVSHAIGDEFKIQLNNLAGQLDRLSFSWRWDGMLEAFWWDSADFSGTPRLLARGDILEGARGNTSLHLTILMVPGVGVVFASVPPEQIGERSVGRSLLVPTPQRYDNNGKPYVCDASKLRIAINPRIDWVLGAGKLTFPASGYFNDVQRALPYPPQGQPTDAKSWFYGGAGSSASIAIRERNSANALTAFTGSTDRYAAQVTLAGDQDSSPFVVGYDFQWPAITATRSTTEWQPDRIISLEITDFYDGRREGVAEIEVKGAAGRAALERGDFTYILERRDSTLSPWQAILRGIATLDGEISLDFGGGRLHYRASLVLHDLRYRLSELSHAKRGVLDGLSIKDAINRVLVAGGLPTLTSWPAVAATTTLPWADPASGSAAASPSFMPREGQDGDAIVRDLLLLLRRKDVEYILLPNYASGTYSVAQRPYAPLPEPLDPCPTFTPFGDEEGEGAILVDSISLAPAPPEANMVKVRAVKDGAASYETQLISNKASLNDPTSKHFQGRARYLVANLSTDQKEVADQWARRLLEATGYRRMSTVVTTLDADLSINVNAPARVRTLTAAGVRGLLTQGWIRRRTVSIRGEEGCRVERVSYEIDEGWSGGI
jgi:hypothetical protein